MSKHNYPLQLERVIAQLEQWRQNAKEELRAPATHDAALELKRQFDAAIACLEFCQRHQIRPNCQTTVLPPTRTRTPSSEYRIVEDHETENREAWTELKVDGQPLRPNEGDILLSNMI